MKNVLKEIFSMSLYLLVVLCMTYLVIHFVGQRTVVDGSSMEPTLQDGDNLIVDKLSYRFHDPERFDVIVFPYQHKKQTFFIKRVIGLPGETVRIDDEGNIYINDEVLSENFGKEVIMNAGVAVEKITLGEGEYFVLGDNRNNSTDSREPSVGNIRKRDIIGKAWVRVWPFDKAGRIHE